MALEQVLEEIRRRAEEERGRLDKEAAQAREQAAAAARAEVEEYRRKTTDRAAREILRVQTQEAAFTELELKREELQMQRELMDRVMRAAGERLLSLPRERNEAVLKALLSHYEKEGALVHAAPKDELFVKMATGLKFAGPLEHGAGLVITSADGTVRVDLTYDTLMADLSDRWMKGIHTRLFG